MAYLHQWDYLFVIWIVVFCTRRLQYWRKRRRKIGRLKAVQYN